MFYDVSRGSAGSLRDGDDDQTPPTGEDDVVLSLEDEEEGDLILEEGEEK